METNPIIQQVIDAIRRDILSNSAFMRNILQNIQLTENNIPPNLILKIMAEANKFSQPPLPKISNKPKQKVSGRAIPKPISISQGSIESEIVSDLLVGNNIYLYGRAGTGKTYLAEAIAETAMSQKFYTINCSQWTSPINIIGGQTIKGYQEGLLIKAWAEGAILILDELPKLDPNTAGLLNDALAKTAAQPSFDENGNVLQETIPFITNGRGEKIYKGQDNQDPIMKFRFGVIGTGNTDMKSVKNTYGGNQKQDYSLVDRFAGSYYVLDYSLEKEKALVYPYVFEVSHRIREMLDDRDSIESISLRTMLNFNRTYEQEMLNKIEGSVFANEIFANSGNKVKPKTFEGAINSFLDMLEPKLAEEIRNDSSFISKMNSEDGALESFKEKFKLKYNTDPKTGEEIKPITSQGE